MERLDWKARICFLICATVPIPYQFHPERVKSAQVYRCDKLDLWSWQDSLNRGKYSAVQPKTPTSRSGSKRGESLAFLYPHHLILYYTNWYDLYCIYICIYVYIGLALVVEIGARLGYHPHIFSTTAESIAKTNEHVAQQNANEEKQ